MAAHCPLTAFLCLAAALLTTGAAAGNDHGCPGGWTPFGTRCFKFFGSKSTWMNAEKSCLSHDANLVSIHSAEEHGLVVDLVKEATGENQWTWIGGHDAVVEKKWMWTDGSVWDYSNWRQNQPDNYRGEEHVAMINYRELFWNDVPEHLTLAYVCAKDAPPKPEVTLGHVQYECTRV